MEKIFKTGCFFILFSQVSAQQHVGINTVTPSAMVDVVSKGNTNGSKALEINNSSETELMKVTDAGNLGINIGTNSPGVLLHVNSATAKNIRHVNLPILNPTDFSTPFNALGADNSNGNVVGVVSPTQYMYYQRGSAFPSTYDFTTNSGGFSLSGSTFINLPITNDSGLQGNSANITFGTDAFATVNGQSASNIQYMIIPTAGVYLFEFYGTARCNRYNNSQNYNLSGNMQVNTIFTTAVGNNYTTNTVFRGLINTMRNDDGSTHNTSYSFANPQTLTVALQTSVPNQKIAMFFQYVSGEAGQFTHNECYFNVPAGANMSYYLIVTKM